MRYWKLWRQKVSQCLFVSESWRCKFVFVLNLSPSLINFDTDLSICPNNKLVEEPSLTTVVSMEIRCLRVMRLKPTPSWPRSFSAAVGSGRAILTSARPIPADAPLRRLPVVTPSPDAASTRTRSIRVFPVPYQKWQTRAVTRLVKLTPKTRSRPRVSRFRHMKSVFARPQTQSMARPLIPNASLTSSPTASTSAK